MVVETPTSHLRNIQFDLEGRVWTVEDIDNLADVLCKNPRCFTKDEMDLGYCTVDPFRIDLKAKEVGRLSSDRTAIICRCRRRCELSSIEC